MDGFIEIAGHRWPVTNWRVGTVAPFATFAVGERTIARHPEADDAHHWQGTIDNEGYRGRVWRARNIGSVIDQMEKDLGPIDVPDQPTKYTITE